MRFKTKYNDMIGRSFKTKLDVFLFDSFIKKKPLNDIQQAEFLNYEIKIETIKSYESAWQLKNEELTHGVSAKEIDKAIEDWHRQNTIQKTAFLVAYREAFKTKFSYQEFENFFKLDDNERICSYCKVSDAEIASLRNKELIYTKRGRGRQMEIDRKNSNVEYFEDNILLSCYWCNNAKTDEFTAEEFKLIGREIKNIWDSRIKNKS